MSIGRKICLALGCGVLTASAALAVNPKPAVPFAVRSHNQWDEPQDYRAWIDSALARIDSDDVGQQRKAVDLLSITIVDPAVQQKVLAALEPHLKETNWDLRLRFVTAYGHWSTRYQFRQLQQIVQTEDPDRSQIDNGLCWVVAIGDLISIDPDAARSAMEQRKGNGTTRDRLQMQLRGITLDITPSQPIAFAFLKQLDPDDSIVKMSPSEALALLKSESAADRFEAANVLAHAVVVADHPSETKIVRLGIGSGSQSVPSTVDRSEILKALRPHINTVNRAAIPFVQAFAHWAGPADISTLKQLIATDLPNGDTLQGGQDCWAAALMGLARLDPQAAATAARSRANVPFFPFSVHNLLGPIAQGNSADSSVACWLIGMLDTQLGQPRFPPGFNPMPQQSPAVTGRTE